MMLVAHLDADVAGLAARKPVPSNLGHRRRGFALGLIQVGKLQPFVIG